MRLELIHFRLDTAEDSSTADLESWCLETSSVGSETNTDIVKQQCIECDSYDFSLPSHMLVATCPRTPCLVAEPDSYSIQWLSIQIPCSSLMKRSLESWSCRVEANIHSLFMQHITSRTTINYACLMHHFSRPGAVSFSTDSIWPWPPLMSDALLGEHISFSWIQ